MAIIPGNFGRIGVLMGGPSAERPISLKSANAVYESLKSKDCDVVKIDIFTDDIEQNKRLLRSSGIDCAFIALHGRFGEDGQIQQILQDLGIPYTGSGVKASSLAMDKVMSLALFKKAGLDIPEYISVKRQRFECSGSPEIDFPLPWVVKPSRQGSSIGLSIIDSADALDQALAVAFETDGTAIVQQFVGGRELTVGVLDGEPLPVVEIVTTRKFFDYEAKYQSGFTTYEVPAKLNASDAIAVQKAGVCAHKALGCSGCTRVDVILSGGIPFVLELNNIPGLTEKSLLPKAAICAGIDFSQLCLRMLSSAYEKK
ncbi:MAG: D-alanine--D-alanine ligase [Candidatus Omnitrophica bacterium]|jgi:D-alanine-D-alanine ligase|nr:D-alanine--D-alanine ligase [Candidatus Omnitrophota bacterium]